MMTNAINDFMLRWPSSQNPRRTDKKYASGFAPRPPCLKSFLAFVVLGVGVFTNGLVFALPEGEQVAAGSADFDRSAANQLNITTSDKVIINYNSFSIAGNEGVRFIQPGSSSVALNRVTGGSVSEIFGSLASNGQIFLINPNGVVIGPTASVNVGGLVASSLDIADADFLAGNYVFAQTGANPGYVINNGAIAAAGSVALLGGAVANNGIIEASLGSINLAAGSKATVSFDPDGLINVVVDEAVTQAAVDGQGRTFADAVANAGSIEAPGGRVLMTAKTAYGIFDKAVNNTGIVRAVSAVQRGGVVRLMASNPIANTGATGPENNLGKVQDAQGVVMHSGIIDVSAGEAGAASGEVTLAGERVGVSGTIDAAGGGRVLITSTDLTVVTKTGAINTSAQGAGSGGNVVIWSDNATVYEGSLSARGGASGGDAGDAEISGYENLRYRGTADLSASAGNAGTLLLDPAVIQITGGVLDGSDNTNASAFQLINDAGSNILGTIQVADEGAGSPNPFLIFESELESTDAAIVLQARVSVTTSGDFGGDAVTLLPDRSLTITTRNSAADGAGSVNLTGSADGVNLEFKTQGTGTMTIQGSTDGGAVGNVVVGKLTTAGGTIGLVTNNGTITVNNAIATDAGFNAGAVTVIGPLALGANVSIDTDAAGADANININQTLNGARTLTLTAGGGDINFSGIIGGTTPPTGLTVNSANATTFNAASTFAGTVGITSVNVNFNAGMTTTSGGAVTITNSGTLFMAAVADLLLDGAFRQNGSGPITTSADITTTDDNIQFDNNVTLNGAVALNTGAGGAGDITFLGTLNGAQTLALTAGTGNIFTGGVTGGVTPLTGLTVNSAAATTFNAATTIAGPVAITSGNVNFNTAFTTTTGGTLTVTNSGTLFQAAAGDLVLDGAFNQNGAGPVSTSGDITTTNDAISFSGAVTLGGAVALSSGAGAGDITFNSTLNGAQALTLTAGTGSISFVGVVGGVTPLTGLTVNSAAATTFNAASSFAGGVAITAGAVNLNFPITTTGGGTVTITNSGVLTLAAAADLNLDGAFTQNGAGTVTTAGDITTSDDNISFATAVTLSGSVLLTTGAGGIGDITFNNALNGAQALTLTAGTGNIVFAGVVGGVTPLTGLTVNSAAATTFNAASSFAGNVGITSVNVNLNFAMTTTGSGNVTITNSGTLSMAAAGDLNLTGFFNQNGAGPVSTAGDITTASNNITFAGAVTLTGPVALSNTAGIGDITFNNTLNGAQALTVTGNTGNVAFGGIVGGVTPLTGLTVNSAAVTTFNAAATVAGAIAITSGGVNFNFALTTTTGGTVTVTNSGTLFFAAAGDLNLDGAFTQNGAGAVNTSGDITTTNDNISFATAVTLQGSLSMSTGAGIGNILFSSTLNGTTAGTENLTLAAGTGNVTFTGSVGGATRVGILTINSSTDVTAAAITAASINQTAGTGTTTLNGAVNTNTAAGVNLTGTNLAVNAAIDATAGSGTVTTSQSNNTTIAANISSGGAMAFTSDNDSSGAGSFNQTAGIISTVPANVNITITSGSAAAGGNVTVTDVRAGTGTIGVNALSGTINENGSDATPDLTATTIVLRSRGGIGNLGTLEIDAGTTSLTAVVTGTGNIDITDTAGGLLIELAQTANGSITIGNTSGDMTVKTVNANGAVNLTSLDGGILSGSSGGTNVTATQNSSLTARGPSGTVGDDTTPLSVNITGTLTVIAEGSRNGVSVNLRGSISGGLILGNDPPGLVIFNNEISGGSTTNVQGVIQGIGALFATDFIIPRDFDQWWLLQIRNGAVINEELMESPAAEIDGGKADIGVPPRWQQAKPQ